MIREDGHAEAKMREAGLRVTPQRRAVWSAFGSGEDGHLAADEVFARARRGLPELSRATVYNTLAAFVEAGMLQAVESRGAVLYDPNPDPDHHHFRCRGCDRLYDVPVEGVDGIRISATEKFVVESKTVLLRGLCPPCSTAAGSGV
ncbi:transcriptional repressor [Rubrobacter tropicus]|uniref:Transcriptional repressor n=1 Tax=Rubrobacter tropicus TaxID=2653851 RepID=A0A6G8QC30_9ACTN|nr:transcriptional repressor [Rubrobacter tropicus]QIN83827.1 transcriptional repressor [Rubrobacter tropicus]